MAYDKNLDIELSSKEVLDDGDTRLTIAVYQYNGAAPKAQIKREVHREGEDWKFAKLGRLTFEEMQAVENGLKWAYKIAWKGTCSELLH